MGQSIHSQDVQHVEAINEPECKAVDNTVYKPTLDFSDEAQCQPQSEVPIIDEISDELLMHGIECDVEHAGTEVQVGPEVQAGSEVQVEPEVQAGPEVQVGSKVHDGSEVEPPEEEVYIPSFDYVPDGCHSITRDRRLIMKMRRLTILSRWHTCAEMSSCLLHTTNPFSSNNM